MNAKIENNKFSNEIGYFNKKSMPSSSSDYMDSTITFKRLRRQFSKVEKNKKVVFDRKFVNTKKKIKLSHSLQKIQSNPVPNPSVLTQKNSLNPPQFLNLKFLCKTNKKRLDPPSPCQNSILDSLEKSKKLPIFMEKLGPPSKNIKIDNLWSRSVHKRKFFFNSSVINSCSISMKLLNTSDLTINNAN